MRGILNAYVSVHTHLQCPIHLQTSWENPKGSLVTHFFLRRWRIFESMNESLIVVIPSIYGNNSADRSSHIWLYRKGILQIVEVQTSCSFNGILITTY